ncbi:MAG: CRISPR-associated protein Csm2 [Methanothermococcus sp.]|uniref:type III-A CRISPR-associated protein Csm2 n=1 Tax=Methanothermococcus TaxID=155862 RepID=UPI000364126D|nr:MULTISPECIES: type III-A CRISPR-associated protein Csm2 [Methanothermococcus]MDK2790381.1 CRISPR-associated protein Csm2 [Methanothermococcus sp.]MDK2987508.1 CRISPR-associated protein Csm2 [Methanothermococcus sp.]
MNWANNPNVKFKGGGNFMGKQKNKNYQNPGNQNERRILSDEDIENILDLKPKNIGILIKKSDELAEEIGDLISGKKRIERISSSKLRDFYDYVVQIKESKDDKWYLKLMLLKPKMTYHASKENEKSDKRKALELFNNEISRILDKIDRNNDNHFENFKTFFEAVVAYHKKYTKSN